MNNSARPAKATPTETRLALLRGGYCPLAVNGKIPLAKGRQEQLSTGTDDVVSWAAKWPHATNTGILCRHTPCLDIDILSPEAAAAAEELVRSRFEDNADIVVRIGKPPKRAIPFRTDTPFDKIAVNLTAANGDTGQKIEFLANGQQCVVDGVHPQTQSPYTWFGKNLADIPRDALPYIDDKQAQQLVDDIVELLVAEHGYTVSSKHQKPNGGAGESHAELVRRLLAGESYHDALTALAWRFIGAGMPGGQAVEHLRALMLTATPHDERWQARFDEIPRLVSSAEVKQAKQDAATNEKVASLDQAVAQMSGAQIDGAALLDQVHGFLGRFVAYPSPEAHDAHTLWVAHTHAMHAWESTPRIAFLSPEPGSGKTRALEATEPLVLRPVEAVNVSPAYLFRKIGGEDGLPVILFDEIDTVFGPKAKENEEIRGLLGSAGPSQGTDPACHKSRERGCARRRHQGNV